MTGERQPPKGGFDTVNPGPKSTFHTATPLDFLIKTHENPAFMGDFPLKRSISMDFPMDLPSPQGFFTPLPLLMRHAIRQGARPQKCL